MSFDTLVRRKCWAQQQHGDIYSMSNVSATNDGGDSGARDGDMLGLG